MWLYFIYNVINSNIIGEAPSAKKKEDVHVPAKNIGDIKSAEKVRFAPVPPTQYYFIIPALLFKSMVKCLVHAFDRVCTMAVTIIKY